MLKGVCNFFLSSFIDYVGKIMNYKKNLNFILLLLFSNIYFIYENNCNYFIIVILVITAIVMVNYNHYYGVNDYIYVSC